MRTTSSSTRRDKGRLTVYLGLQPSVSGRQENRPGLHDVRKQSSVYYRPNGEKHTTIVDNVVLRIETIKWSPKFYHYKIKTVKECIIELMKIFLYEGQQVVNEWVTMSSV